MNSSLTDNEPVHAGLFVSFEGGDGSGKSTQVALLAAVFQAAGRQVVCTREPGGTPLGEKLRELLMHGGKVDERAEALLYAADRAQHVCEVVRPALNQDAVVISDRYSDSSVAYQGVGRGLDAYHIFKMSMWASRALIPDITFVLDVDPEVARKRLVKRGVGADRLEAAGDEFHQKVRKYFRDLTTQDSRCQLIDAAGSVEEVHERIMVALKARGYL
ncbi:MAG: dTMP kinase [Actinomycetaceae bacterium]|nr:dTMP kinase [Actinomycetaceae bacterium]